MVSSEPVTAAGGPEDLAPRATNRQTSPSAWRWRLVVALLAAVDFALAVPMALYQWRWIDAVWDPVFGPEQSHQVLDSAVSEALRRVLWVPDAAWGAAAYLAEVVLALVGSQQRWRTRPWLVLAFGAIALAVALAGAALVVLQATVVKAWCLLCLITAALSVGMAIAALPEVRASWGYLWQTWRASPNSEDEDGNHDTH